MSSLEQNNYVRRKASGSGSGPLTNIVAIECMKRELGILLRCRLITRDMSCRVEMATRARSAVGPAAKWMRYYGLSIGVYINRIPKNLCPNVSEDSLEGSYLLVKAILITFHFNPRQYLANCSWKSGKVRKIAKNRKNAKKRSTFRITLERLEQSS